MTDRLGWPKIPFYGQRRKIVSFVSTCLNNLQLLLAGWLIIQVYRCYSLFKLIFSSDVNVAIVLLKTLTILSVLAAILYSTSVVILKSSAKENTRLKRRIYKVWSLLLWTYIAFLTSTSMTIKPVLQGTIKQLNTTYRRGLSKYSEDIELIKSLDKIQFQLSCCGIVGPEDWIYVRRKSDEDETEGFPESCCRVGKVGPCLLETQHSSDLGLVEQPSNIAFRTGCAEKLDKILSTYIHSYTTILTFLIVNLIFLLILQRILINWKEGRIDNEGYEFTWIFEPLPLCLFGRKIRMVGELDEENETFDLKEQKEKCNDNNQLPKVEIKFDFNENPKVESPNINIKNITDHIIMKGYSTPVLQGNVFQPNSKKLDNKNDTKQFMVLKKREVSDGSSDETSIEMQTLFPHRIVKSALEELEDNSNKFKSVDIIKRTFPSTSKLKTLNTVSKQERIEKGKECETNTVRGSVHSDDEIDPCTGNDKGNSEDIEQRQLLLNTEKLKDNQRPADHITSLINKFNSLHEQKT